MPEDLGSEPYQLKVWIVESFGNPVIAVAVNPELSQLNKLGELPDRNG